MPSYKNILVFVLAGIGDVLLSTSAIALLRKRFPDARITMMVKASAEAIVRNNPVIDDVIIYQYKSKSVSLSALLVMVKLLRHRQFDLSIAFDPKFRSNILIRLAGVPVRVGQKHILNDTISQAIKMYTHAIPIEHDAANTLQAENYQAMVRGFTGQKDKALPVMARIMPENQQRATELLQSLAKNNEKTYQIALCVKGTFPLKNWPQDRFAALIDALSKKHAAHFFIIGATEDKTYADEVIGMTKVPVANFCGQTSLVDLAALLQQSDLFITVDTGAAHIAATTGVSMLTIFGCTSIKCWQPISRTAVVLTTEEPCCPCSRAQDECPEHFCMNKISVAMVTEKVEELLIGMIEPNKIVEGFYE